MILVVLACMKVVDMILCVYMHSLIVRYWNIYVDMRLIVRTGTYTLICV